MWIIIDRKSGYEYRKSWRSTGGVIGVFCHKGGVTDGEKRREQAIRGYTKW